MEEARKIHLSESVERSKSENRISLHVLMVGKFLDFLGFRSKNKNDLKMRHRCPNLKMCC